jgi:hypothetical protein
MLPWTRWLNSLASALSPKSGARRTKKQASKPRRGRRMTVELLESRLVPSAVVSLDHQDYAPDSTAIITASNDTGPLANFSVGETVHFHIDRTDGISVNVPPAVQDWYVTDGVGGFTPYQDSNGLWQCPDTDGVQDGNIGTTWYVDSQFAGASLQLTATGQTSGAVATSLFTDSSTPTLTITGLDKQDDTGISHTDGITSKSTPQIIGGDAFSLPTFSSSDAGV